MLLYAIELIGRNSNNLLQRVYHSYMGSEDASLYVKETKRLLFFIYSDIKRSLSTSWSKFRFSSYAKCMKKKEVKFMFFGGYGGGCGYGYGGGCGYGGGSGFALIIVLFILLIIIGCACWGGFGGC